MYSNFELLPIINFFIGIENMELNHMQNKKVDEMHIWVADLEKKIDKILKLLEGNNDRRHD